jgi:cysteine desulfuration protein SufE
MTRTDFDLDMETIRETFALLEDWEARYRYIIDLGRTLEPFPEGLRTDEARVAGCTSRVWLVAQVDAHGRYRFLADSDAHIVRGLIAILLAGVQDKTASEIAAFDVLAFFRDLGLEEHLSPSRRNGFYAMAQKIRTLASHPANGVPERI